MIYVFDWGDTLMVDFKDKPGPMKDWDFVQEVSGASELLSDLSVMSKLYVATGANCSPENIEAALSRVHLSQYIEGYFCPSIIGCGKPSIDFYSGIASRLGVTENKVTMIGDSLEKDILPSVKVGMSAIWLNPTGQVTNETGFTQVSTLSEVSR